MCIPPISTFRSGLRAYWVNWRGARRLDDLAAHPAREADPLAVDVGAGVAQQRERLGVAAELEADLLEDRVGVVLDERQALLAEDLERRERAGQERDVLGVGRQPERLAGGPAAAAPPRAVSSISRPPCVPTATAPAPSSLVAGVGAGRRRSPARRVAAASTTRRQVREGGRLVREGHRLDEVLLEARLDGGLDLLDPPDDALDLGPRRARQQRDERARSRPRCRPSGRGPRSQSGMSPRTIAWIGSIWLPNAPARRISSTVVDPELVHQQPDAGVERGLGELDGPDVVLGDGDPRAGAGPSPSWRT